jgi:thimet oligopeptidase
MNRHNIEGNVQKSVVMMNANFAEDNLLTHDDVSTFFHEFGHIMHNMCAISNFSRLSGASVERDFVELPSQMLENWTWDRSILKRLGKHNETGKPLPDELIDAKLAQRTGRDQTMDSLSQFYLAIYDFVVYSEHEPSVYKKGIIGKARAAIKHTEATGGINTTDVFAFVKKAVMFQEPRVGSNMALTSFTHTINAGYASKYFSYQWALVYAQDLFTEFEKHGIMNKEVGARYRKYILEPSGMNSGFQKLKDFLGREPSEDAYLNLNGFSYSKTAFATGGL